MPRMIDGAMDSPTSYGSLTRYFVPLALQAISQSLTYPLVAMVAARGEGGAANIAALAQSGAMFFFLYGFATGLITTGMVYAHTAQGLAAFRRLNSIVTAGIMVAHLLCCLPPVSHVIFGVLMGLPPALERPTAFYFMLIFPLSLIFNIRNPAMIVLFNEKATGLAYAATLGRIALTLVFSAVCCAMGLVGLVWAMIAQTIPMIAEAYAFSWFARPFIRKLPDAGGPVASLTEMFNFTMSFSIGKVLMWFSTYLIGAFAARAAAPELMLPVYYAALGLVNPVSFGASRAQALVIGFDGNRRQKRRILDFTYASGIVLGFFPLLFLLPGVCEWYYVTLQKIPYASIPDVRLTALWLVPLPLVVAVRSYAEGRAAVRRKPLAVMAGQGVYLGLAAAVAFFCLDAGMSGNLIGPVALLVGNIFAAIVIGLAIRTEDPPTAFPRTSTQVDGE